MPSRKRHNNASIDCGCTSATFKVTLAHARCISILKGLFGIFKSYFVFNSVYMCVFACEVCT